MKKAKIVILVIIACLCTVLSFSCKKKVEKGALQSIELSGYTTEFAYGEDFSVGSLVVTAKYQSGESETVTSYVVDDTAYNSEVAGTHQITIMYKGKTASYSVTVAEIADIVSISVIDQTMEFAIGTPFRFGGAVKAVYLDGSERLVDGYAVDSSAYNRNEKGEYLIIVTYKGKTTSYMVRVSKYINVDTVEISDQTKVFDHGKEFVFDGKVTVKYLDGTSEDITDYDVDSSDYDAFESGKHEIRILVDGNSYDYKVTVEKANTLKLLMIGNSFAEDTILHMSGIAKSVGYDDFVVGALIKGGGSLDDQLSLIASGDSAYDFIYFEAGDTAWNQYRSSQGNGKSIDDGIIFKDWDYITIQQVSQDSGREETYETSKINQIVDYVRSKATNKDVKFIWNMTWAYQANSTHSGFANYGYKQATMYNAIVNAVQNKILTNENFAAISPAGTAIQNARTSYLGDNLTRDGYHLQVIEGRYISGLTMFCLLTGYSPYDVSYVSTMDSKMAAVAKESVKNALKNKFSVTNSEYTV